jgi:hypothetical protein
LPFCNTTYIFKSVDGRQPHISCKGKEDTAMETITKAQLKNIGRSFVNNEITGLLSITLGDDRSNLALDLEAHPSWDRSGTLRSEFEIESLLERCHDFAFEAKQGGDDRSDQQELETLTDINLDGISTLLLEDKADFKSALHDLLDVHQARMILEFGDDDDHLTRDQIAALSDLAVETVRLAGFADGDDKLPQERPGVARKAEVKRWLIHKNRYTEFKRSPPFILTPDAPAETVKELIDTIRLQAYRHLPQTGDIHNLLDDTQDQAGLSDLLERRTFNPNNLSWITPENAITIGKRLELDARWLFENLDRHGYDVRRTMLASEISDEPFEEPMQEAPTDQPVTRELIRKVLQDNQSIERHPAQKGPNKKLDGYRINDGPTFAHQHDGKAQILWLPETAPLPDGIPAQHYPSVGSGEPVARHSGLIKFPELGRQAVKKVKVKNRDMLNQIVGMLLGSQDET